MRRYQEPRRKPPANQLRPRKGMGVGSTLRTTINVFGVIGNVISDVGNTRFYHPRPRLTKIIIPQTLVGRSMRTIDWRKRPPTI